MSVAVGRSIVILAHRVLARRVQANSVLSAPGALEGACRSNRHSADEVLTPRVLGARSEESLLGEQIENDEERLNELCFQCASVLELRALEAATANNKGNAAAAAAAAEGEEAAGEEMAATGAGIAALLQRRLGGDRVGPSPVCG